MSKPPLRSFRVENFKAIQDSGDVHFGWLTAFIGNNGSGKSSLVEALETFRDVIHDGVDAAFERWRGFEHAWNKSRERTLLERPGQRPGYSNPMRFRLHWKTPGREFQFRQAITQGPGGDTLFIQQEEIVQRRPDRREFWSRDENGKVLFRGERPAQEEADRARMPKRSDGQSLLHQFAWDCFERWRFLMLNPEGMAQPKAQQRAGNGVQINRDGSNVAQYLQEIRDLDPSAFEGILDTLHYVLPYAAGLQPTLTSELERAFYLKLKGKEKVSGTVSG